MTKFGDDGHERTYKVYKKKLTLKYVENIFASGT